MKKKKHPKPTNSEIDILRILWEQGPSTVREVQEALGKARKTGYTTALKFLQIMAEKGLVCRDESRHAHVYRAGFAQEQTQRQLVDDFLDRVFSGSALKLVMQALSTRKTSPEELEQIRKLLDDIEEDSP